MEVELPVLWLTEEQTICQKAGVDVDLVEIHTLPHTFYSIDNIRPFNDQGKNMTMVVSGSISHIVPLTYQEVQKKIHDNLIFKFN